MNQATKTNSSSGIYMLLNKSVEFLLGFVGFMFLVRILSVDEFGTWVLFLTTIGIVEMARYGFLQNGLIKFLVGENTGSYREIMSASLFLNAILTLIFILLLLLIAPALAAWLSAEELRSLIFIHCLVLPIHVIHTQSLILLQAKMDFKAYFYSGIFKSLPFFILITSAYFSSYPLNLIELVWFHNIALLLATVMSYFQAKQYLLFSKKLSKQWMNKIFHFGKFVFGTNLMVVLYNSLDKFLLAFILSPVQVAISNTAGRMLNFIEVPINSIASVTYPVAANQASKNETENLARLYERSVSQMLAFTIPFMILVFILAEPIILIIAGEAYLDAVKFLRIIIIISIFRPFDRQTGVFLDAINKPNINFFFVTLTLISIVVLSITLISIMGLYGAAWALLISIVLVTLLKQAYLRKFLKFSYLESFRLLPVIYKEYLEKILSKIKR